MRLAIFCPTVSGAGGMESAIQNILAGCDSLGIPAHLFLFGGTFNPAWLQGLPHTIIGSPSEPRLSRLARYALGATRAIRSWRPTAILCSDVSTIQMARLGRTLALRPRVPIASWLHFPLNEIRFRDKLHLADLHLTISQHIADDLRSALPAQANKIHIIYNAIPTGHANLIPRPATPVFVYVGRLNFNDHKRVNDILLAVAKLRGPWRLRLVGAAPAGKEDHSTRLHALAEELGITDRIDWLGWQRDPWVVLPEATALISSSAREGFPMNLIEACNHGVPCVASNCTGSAEVIQPGKNGWLFPIADVDALAHRLQLIVDQVADPTIPTPDNLPSPAEVQASVQQFSATAVVERIEQAFRTPRS